MRAERDEYKQAADALARALNVLTAENDELRRKIGRLRQGQPLAHLVPANNDSSSGGMSSSRGAS
jgi:cell division protein FtsB